jgi:hypothetical protein
MEGRAMKAVLTLCWLLLPSLLTANGAMTPEQLQQWFEDDSEQRALDVSEGELAFLPSRPTRADGRPLPHSFNRLTIAADSLDSGWVWLQQCHRGLDAVAEAQVVYRYKQMRGLRVASHSNIGRAWVEGASVQLQDVGREAKLCIEAEVRVFYRNPDGSFSLVNGPYHRKFLDGYYPYHVTLEVHYPADRLAFRTTRPSAQPGLVVMAAPGTLTLDAWFEGKLNTEIHFAPR